jgi:capsular polysaccharide export protein
VGPFFARLSAYLKKRGSNVYKVNFNPGDEYFYNPENAISYKHTPAYWPQFLAKLLIEKDIDAIILFGDCRPIHIPAKSLTQSLGIDLWVLEEGYIRPHFYTLEKNGVNGHSGINELSLQDIKNSSDIDIDASHNSFRHGYLFMALWSIQYWAMCLLFQLNFPDYDHHRKLDLYKGFCWIRNIFRLYKYKFLERKLRWRIASSTSENIFLFPLQVHNDFQIKSHSPFDSIEQTIEVVINSFAGHISSVDEQNDYLLVIKHHPMDRGHKNYKNYINNLATTLGCRENIIYIHEYHVPSLLKKCKGCVTVNSTIGLQALHHRVRVKTLGISIYNKDGLSFQGSLDQFWECKDPVNSADASFFRNYLIYRTQINGCLYSPDYQIS